MSNAPGDTVCCGHDDRVAREVLSQVTLPGKVDYRCFQRARHLNGPIAELPDIVRPRFQQNINNHMHTNDCREC